MNQAFRHNFDADKEDSKPAQTLSGSFNLTNAYIEAGHTRNICFVWLDGKRMFLNYSYLISGNFSPGESTITLHFTSHVFIVKGLNLENLFYDLMNQIARQIVIIDKRYNDLQEENLSIVNEITLKLPDQH